MGLSKGQKKRLYGENTTADVTETPQVAPVQSGSPKRSSQYVRNDFRATPESGQSTYMFAGVALVIAVLMGAYYFGWVLPSMGARAGTLMPELRLWFNAEILAETQDALGTDLIRDYQLLHRSTGLVFPLIFAASWLGMISAAKLPAKSARINKLVPILFAFIFIAGNFTLDAALANPLGGAVLPAAALIFIRWWLLVLCILQVVWLAIRLIRGKIDDFAEGKLPGQQ